MFNPSQEEVRRFFCDVFAKSRRAAVRSRALVVGGRGCAPPRARNSRRRSGNAPFRQDRRHRPAALRTAPTSPSPRGIRPARAAGRAPRFAARRAPRGDGMPRPDDVESQRAGRLPDGDATWPVFSVATRDCRHRLRAAGHQIAARPTARHRCASAGRRFLGTGRVDGEPLRPMRGRHAAPMGVNQTASNAPAARGQPTGPASA